MVRWIGSNEHEFNVGGKQKCDYCGLYFPDTQESHGCHAEKLALGKDDSEE